jgi:hypothetical protein
MKNLFVAALFTFMAGGAFAAANDSFVMQPLRYGDRYAEPCPTAPDVPVPANGACGEGMVCPGGYEAAPKYCFDGGLHQCGFTCESIYKGN